MADAVRINMTTAVLLFIVFCLMCFQNSSGWIHNLKLQTDDRRDIMLTHTFGFLKAGTLTVNVTMFSFKPIVNVTNTTFGFTLDKSKSPGLNSYVESMQKCALNDTETKDATVIFRFDFVTKSIYVERRGDDLKHLLISATPAATVAPPTQGSITTVTADSTTTKPTKAPDVPDEKGTPNDFKTGKTNRKKRAEDSQKETPSTTTPQTTNVVQKKETIPLKVTGIEDGLVYYQTYFQVTVSKDSEEGLYNLYFHNCRKENTLVNLSIQIIQKNDQSYLSADEMPIPTLYFVFSVIFFIMTILWFVVLHKAKEGVYKIHYLMLVVVFFKSISNLFHGVNMHMIEKTGIHVDAWAILWYIVYLMRGAVLFVTVLLIGAGWAFIKHVFTDREKKLFLIVIPLQILMNVAWVIVEESEEGYPSYDTWHKIFMGVDLLCCFAILFPVIWSIRHLQEASKTDGKAAINLNKLKLFRHFYIMVVAYIYFTRIIGYLLLITLPFRYGWMKDLFEEVFLLVFFGLTGYKFRPTSDNPYLMVPLDSDDEEEIEMDEVVTKSGSTEGLVRVNQGKTEDPKKTAAIKQRESSHEYD